MVRFKKNYTWFNESETQLLSNKTSDLLAYYLGSQTSLQWYFSEVGYNFKELTFMNFKEFY